MTMNKQRKVLITITYNEMGIIIDTKAEEAAQPNLQQTCNKLATDCISRQAAIDATNRTDYIGLAVEDVKKVTDAVIEELKRLPSAQPEIIRCKNCKYVWKENRYDNLWCSRFTDISFSVNEDGGCTWGRT